MRQNIWDSKKSPQAIAFQSREAILITDEQGCILDANPAFEVMTGYLLEEVVGKTTGLIESDRHNSGFYVSLWKTLQDSGEWRGEVWCRSKSGLDELKWLSFTAVPPHQDQPLHYVAIYLDISQRKVLEDRLHELAFFDPLTLLPNRRLLIDRLGHALSVSSRTQRLGAVMFLDLDNFKTLNDTLGHDMGDKLLVEVAHRLQQSVRAGDTVARLGGDEFVIMLEDLDSGGMAAAQAEVVAVKVLRALSLTYKLALTHPLQGQQIVEHHCTTSIGITLFSSEDTTVDDLLKRADLAMYQAKDAGRNTLRFFDADMQASFTARAELGSDLRKGIDESQFVIHFQPQASHNAEMIGVEALVRWNHPLHGLISPLDFIHVAEETGLILPLGDWVLNTACEQLAAWALIPDYSHLTISVNVSVRQINHPDFVIHVLDTLHRTGAPPYLLKLEITESLLVKNIDAIIGKMALLKKEGIGFALDDFGTGYSSLSYLKLLPIDELKIDQSFVRDLLTDPNDAAIASSIIALAQTLGLKVVAEGVESIEQKNFLAQMGCYAYQGYLLSPPLPLSELERFVRPVSFKLSAN